MCGRTNLGGKKIIVARRVWHGLRGHAWRVPTAGHAPGERRNRPAHVAIRSDAPCASTAQRAAQASEVPIRGIAIHRPTFRGGRRGASGVHGNRTKSGRAWPVPTRCIRSPAGHAPGERRNRPAHVAIRSDAPCASTAQRAAQASEVPIRGIAIHRPTFRGGRRGASGVHGNRTKSGRAWPVPTRCIRSPAGRAPGERRNRPAHVAIRSDAPCASTAQRAAQASEVPIRGIAIHRPTFRGGRRGASGVHGNRTKRGRAWPVPTRCIRSPAGRAPGEQRNRPAPVAIRSDAPCASTAQRAAQASEVPIRGIAIHRPTFRGGRRGASGVHGNRTKSGRAWPVPTRCIRSPAGHAPGERRNRPAHVAIRSDAPCASTAQRAAQASEGGPPSKRRPHRRLDPNEATHQAFMTSERSADGHGPSLRGVSEAPPGERPANSAIVLRP